jgi:hypothetical protein
MTDPAAPVTTIGADPPADYLTVPVGPMVKLCPTCRAVLDGGPIWFRCAACGKAVRAVRLHLDTDRDADWDAEHAAALGRAA